MTSADLSPVQQANLVETHARTLLTLERLLGANSCLSGTLRSEDPDVWGSEAGRIYCRDLSVCAEGSVQLFNEDNLLRSCPQVETM